VSPLIGELQFSTRARPEILGYGLDDQGNGCAVFSEPAGVIEVTSLSVDGVDIPIEDVFHLDRVAWYDPYMLQQDDQGLDVVCVVTSAPVPETGTALVGFDDVRTWTGTVQPSVVSVVKSLRRDLQ
jgi:hypothetical protein